MMVDVGAATGAPHAPPPLPAGPAPPLPGGDAPGAPPPLPPQDGAPPPLPAGTVPPLPGSGAGPGPSSAAAGAAAAAPGAAPTAAAAAAAAAATGGDAGPSTSAPPIDEGALKEFFSEMRDVDRDNEVNRILWAFKLNPFEKLNLRFTATPEEIKKQFRKVSLMVHPDKCSHPQAAAAFDVLGAAQKELLDDTRREELLVVLNKARDEVRAERAKETKHDSAVALAATLHERGREGVEEEWEQTDAFHERWKLKARDVLAKAEWRKRKLAKRLKDETARVDEEHKEHVQEAKRQKEHSKAWESSRETRVNTWRDYVKGGKGKPKAAAQLKPPKQKTWDEDKTYVQRPVGEQFRPPPAKPVTK